MVPGGIEYLVAGDGYSIVLVSLEHYVNRLKTIGSDPASNAGMFGSAIRQAAIKRYPVARRVQHTVLDFLAGGSAPTTDDMQTIKNALECYESDVRQTAAKYNTRRMGPGIDPVSTMQAIREAKARFCMAD